MKKTIRLCLLFLFGVILFLPYHVFALSDLQTLEKKMDAYLEEHNDKIASLATVVIKDDETIYTYKGHSDIERGVRVSEQTVFEWGSASKLLIWISVMQLVEDNVIDLHTDIREYLPGDFIFTFKHPVTMFDLMNHQAGFDDSYTDLMLHEPAETVSLRQALEQADVKQVFRPGEVVAYSNFGSALAAYIVEEVSGQDYRDYVKNNIFIPLGMTHTAIDAEQQDNLWVKKQRGNIQGYTTDKQFIDPNLYVIPIYPAGSVMGTAEDFSKLLKALLSENGLPLFKDEKTIDVMFEPTSYYPETEIPRIAHGLFSLPGQSQIYGHGGNTIAFSSSIYVDRENKLGVLVMMNQANEQVFNLGLPELIFAKQEGVSGNKRLEDSLSWEGMYQPARAPYHGFSKIYGFFQRSSVKQEGKHDLTTNGLHYSQFQPGVYMTEDDYRIYSLDIYSSHPKLGKIVSSIYTDLIYVPLYRHVFELCLLIAGVVAFLFSGFYLLRMIYNKMMNKKHLVDRMIIIQHVLNIVVVLNIGWISYKTVSMTSYQSLKIFFWINILYIAFTLFLSGYSMFRRKYHQIIPFKLFSATIIFSFILCVNILYWEFYY